jgi:hypothetical protein
VQPGVVVRLIWALFVVGCAEDDPRDSVSAETFVSEYPVVFCDLWAECNPDKLQDLYDGDLSICVEDLEDTQRDRLDRDGCSFDDSLAADCLDALEAIECVDWEEGEGNVCGDVIDCS